MFDHSDLYFATVTVGKKGQIIIPAKLRKALSIAPEEHLIILYGPHKEGFAVLNAKSSIEKQDKFKKLTEQIFGESMDSIKTVKNKENRE